MSTRIGIEQIQVGMVIDKPIYKHNGVLLIPRQTTITPRVQQLLKEYLVEYIDIEEKAAMPIATSTEAIKETEAFKVFDQGMLATTENLKSTLSHVAHTDEALDVQTLVAEVDNLFKKADNNIQLLDMMYCMRSYDDLTYTHSVNVALMCHIMGRWLGLSEEDMQVLSLCGLLHDVGKVDIPQEIITKPGRLTKEEFDVIKEHPVKGYKILEKQAIDERIKAAVFMHHEKCDGTGYPKGLKGEQIDDFAKIVTIIDVYDAMTANRIYRKGMCPFKVVEALIDEGFEKYDPKYLLLFLERITETYINKPVRLSNGQEGNIVMINKNDLSHPIIQMGNEYINLSIHKQITIEAIL